MSSAQIQQIIDALKAATGSGWQALVSQQYTTGLIGCIEGVVFTFLGLVLLVTFLITVRTQWDVPSGRNVAAIVCAILGTTTLILGVTLFCVDINLVVNPAGAAISQLLSGL